MKFPRLFLFAFAALSLLGSSLGCYTLLKHPRVQVDDRASAYYGDNERVGFADDCASCHSAGSLQTHHSAVPPPRRVVSSTWDYYYDNPWWIPYYAPANNTDGTEANEQKKRPFDRRHLSAPEENVTPSSSASTPAPSTAPTPAIAKSANANEGNATASPKNEDANKREEKRSGDDDKSSERRTRKPKTE